MAQLNLTLLPRNGDWLWHDVMGTVFLWVSTVFSVHGVWAEGDSCHEYNSLIVRRCSGWICLTATGHAPHSSFHYGHWLRDLATL